MDGGGVWVSWALLTDGTYRTHRTYKESPLGPMEDPQCHIRSCSPVAVSLDNFGQTADQ
jgi:hypothetical protein